MIGHAPELRINKESVQSVGQSILAAVPLPPWLIPTWIQADLLYYMFIFDTEYKRGTLPRYKVEGSNRVQLRVGGHLDVVLGSFHVYRITGATRIPFIRSS
jgi:hypothetical protein